MIKLKTLEVCGMPTAILSMRNPLNSWDRSDSGHIFDPDNPSDDVKYEIGPNDMDLAQRLIKGGSVHCKFRRMINAYVDITAPLYWWKQFDTYKVGTVCNSCSTMHKIHDKEFSPDMFSMELITSKLTRDIFINAICELNHLRELYLKTKDKKYWDEMIQLLPSSYNQLRTVMINYEVLSNIYEWRKDHKLAEWHEFCDWIKTLPYPELIIGK